MTETTQDYTVYPEGIIEPKKHELNWNVIDDKEFKSRVRDIFRKVAETLTNTLGPYGATTIIEKFGEMHITKDGWNILKKITFDNGTDNNLLQLLVNISSQVVIKVGDGSTSSIVSANAMLEQLENNVDLKHMRPKELLDLLNTVVSRITTEIQNSATQIDITSDPELNDIYRLAMISTNGDHTVSKIIQLIYKETGNPFIDYKKSKTNVTHHEIVEGYQANIAYLDTLYVNNDEGTCNIEKPYILLFNHKIDKETHWDKFIAPALSQAVSENRRLVVVAPHYDKFMLEHIRIISNNEFRALGTTVSVFTRVSLINNMFEEFFSDFSIMTGARIIRETDLPEFFKDVEEGQTPANVLDFVGEVDSMSVGPELTMAKGFTKRNQSMYEVAMRDALAKYKKVEVNHHELNIVNTELYELKKRISKLRGLMGVVYVGGNSGLEKTSNYDLVEDAVKACESAYSYGYNIGGNLIIPVAIARIQKANEYEEPRHNEAVIYKLLYDSFVNVFTKVLQNKYTDQTPSELLPIIEKAIETETCYDLIKDEYSTEVINPSHTDIEILRAATSIVSLLVSSNQYISIQVNNPSREVMGTV